MSSKVSPIYLFADSELLFWKKEGELFLNSLVASIPDKGGDSTFSAAYIGASNGDEPAYYEIFQAAMGGINSGDTRFIVSAFSVEDREFLAQADVILLAGGDVNLGMSVINSSGMREVILERYHAGAVIVGVSAGAVQLGALNFGSVGFAPAEAGFHLVPFIIACHEEVDDWVSAKQTLLRFAGVDPSAIPKCIGIPKGGGCVYYPNEELEPIKKPLVQLELCGNNVRESIIVMDDALSDKRRHDRLLH